VQARNQQRKTVPGQRAEPDDDQPQDENDYSSDDEYDEGEYDEQDYDEKEYEEKDYDDADPDRQTTRTGAISAAEAAQAALEQMAQLIPKEPEGVTAVEPADGSWIVGVEVVEDRRIPSSTDILATYEATVDADGNLVSYHRTRRYSRGRCDAGGGQ
jgi:Gas vesicle synthesis protein GvpO